MGLIRCILIPRWSLKGSLNQPVPRWSVLEWPTRLIYTDAHASTWSLFAVCTRPSLCIEHVHWWKCFLSWRLHSDQQINCFCLKACLNPKEEDPFLHHVIPSCRWNLNEQRRERKKSFLFINLEAQHCVTFTDWSREKESAGWELKSLANWIIGREQICQLLSWSVLKGKISVASKICLHRKFVESAHGLAR